MAVWTSFIDLVHLIGAVGCVLLTGGFAAQGEPSRAVFYAAATIAFAVTYVHRRHARAASTVRRTGTPRVIELRPDARASASTARTR